MLGVEKNKIKNSGPLGAYIGKKLMQERGVSWREALCLARRDFLRVQIVYP